MHSIPMRAAAGATIPSNYSRIMARELALQIKDIPLLLPGTALTVDQFLQEDTLLTTDEQVRIWQNALRITTDETFGLSLGRRLTLSTHGAIGFLANSSANFYAALQAVELFIPTRISFIRVELLERDAWLDCRIHLDIELDKELQRSVNETLAMVFLEGAKAVIGRSLSEMKIAFPHPAPEYRARYSEYLSGKHTFSAPQLEIKVPLTVCREPNASANQEGYSLALQQCDSMLRQLRSDKQSYSYRIQKMMLSQAPGTLSEDEAAARLFVSKRTLARKLNTEGTGFRKLREDILSQQAASYLRDSQLSVEAIAALLNYFDTANFRRAFKRWFELPPEQYRRQSEGSLNNG